MHTKIKTLLELAVANKASDIHLVVGSVPKVRVNGQLLDINNFGGVEDRAAMGEMITSILTEEQKERFIKEKELDFSLSAANSRFRVNIYNQMGEVGCALRLVPMEIPVFDDLNLPKIFSSFINYRQGFILVTGPTGHGKSTSVASTLNEINKRKAAHIVTVEDPIEYVIKPEKALISQREVGYDTHDFAAALRSCLRQDPNVVFVGEMRDLETVQSALTIAETGHLVFSTLHTNSAAQTMDRIVDVFPDNLRELVRTQLAEVITAVVSQRLIPTTDGKRVPAFEILVATPAVKNIVREGKTFMLDNVIQTSADVGMTSLETSLAQLVKSGRVEKETAMAYCLRPEELENNLRKKI